MILSSTRLGFRLARREIRRHPWRSALVLLMVLVPTMAMTVASTALRTGEWSGGDRRAAEYGQADVIGHLRGTDFNRPVDDETLRLAEGRLRASLPAESFVIAHQAGDRVRTDDDAAYVTLSDLALDAPVVEGRFGPIDGTTPGAPGEAVLTTSLADDLHLDVGDVIRPENLDAPLTVVGLVDRRVGRDEIVYVMPEELAQADFPLPEARTYTHSTTAFIDSEELTGAPVAVDGWRFDATPIRFELDHDDDLFWVYVGGAVGLFLVGTIVAAAFAVGARRQLRTVGLLSATGASPRTIKGLLVTQGVLGGSIGSLLGVATALVAVRLVPDDLVERLYDRPVDGPVTRLSDVIPIVLLGTLAATVAAWFPARSTASVSTLQAIAGRRPLARVPRAVPIIGALAIVGGTGLLAIAVTSNDYGNSSANVLLGIVGSVIVLSGTLGIAPWAVGALERLTTRLPHSGRLAGRSLARSRVRSSAVVGALCAVTATLVAGATLYQSVVHDDQYQDGLPEVASHHLVIRNPASDDDLVAQVEATVDGSQEVTVTRPIERQGGRTREVLALLPNGSDRRAIYNYCCGGHFYDDSEGVGSDVYDFDTQFIDGGPHQTSVGIGTPGLLNALEVPDRLRDALAAGQAISLVSFPRDATEVQFVPTPRAGELVAPLGGSIASPLASGSLPNVLISEDLATDLGFDITTDESLLLDAGRAITSDERRAIELLEQDRSFAAGQRYEADAAYVSLPEEPDRITPTDVRVGIYAFVLLAVGLVVAIGLGLAAKDTQDETQVLSSVGAPPRTLRRVGALRAMFLVVTAMVIAVPTGLFCAWAVFTAVRADEYYGDIRPEGGFPLRMDVPTLVFLLLIPLAVGLVAFGWSSIRDLIRPSRPNAMVFAD